LKYVVDDAAAEEVSTIDLPDNVVLSRHPVTVVRAGHGCEVHRSLAAILQR
jgi:hypothetical protein